MTASSRFDFKQALTADDNFSSRHLGPSPAEEKEMLAAIGFESLAHLSDSAVPQSIKLTRPLQIDSLRS